MIRFILVPSTTDPQLTPINNAVYNQLFWFNLDVVITTLYFTLENTSIYHRIFKNVISKFFFYHSEKSIGIR